MKEEKKVKKGRNYKITDQPDEKYPPEIQALMEKAYYEADKKKPNVNFLESLAEKYPSVPQFKNYLTIVYLKFRNMDKAYRVNNELLSSFPDYIFARLHKAEEYMAMKEYDKVPLILGPELNIGALYPGRNTFHISEVRSFLAVVFNYYLFTDNLDAASDTLEELAETISDDSLLEALTMQLTSKLLEKSMERFRADEAKTRTVEYCAPEIQKTFEKPVFTHQEIEYLYTNGMDIDHQIIKTILELPKETLIADLEMVISDGISRFSQYSELEDYDEPSSYFVNHAIFLLTELRSDKSLPVILDVLRQGEVFFEFWFGDAFTECLWESIYLLGGNQLDVLSAYLKEPNKYTYARCIVSDAIAQIALQQPNRRNEVIGWYRELFTFFLEQIENERIIDSQVISSMIGDILDFRGKELLDKIEALYNADIIPEGINGSLEDVKKEMKEAPKEYYIHTPLIIYDRYTHILNTWNYYKEEDIEDYDYDEDEYEDAEYADEDHHNRNFNYSLPETFVREAPKVGRNDPCPCGSGKKYKKCCLKE